MRYVHMTPEKAAFWAEINDSVDVKVLSMYLL